MSSIHSLVIGGTRGTGRTVVRSLAQEGHTVSVVGRRAPEKQDTSLPSVSHWAANLLDENKTEQTWNEILQKQGPLNNLVFCQQYRGTGNRWQGELETSLGATKNAIEYLALRFAKDSPGTITVISSASATFVTEEQPVGYHVVKAGLDQMVRFYAVTLGPDGIRVNCISSGAVVKEESKGFWQSSEGPGELFSSVSPLGRMVTSQDIANAVVFLSSANASYITGHNLMVDGGISLQWQQSLALKLSQQNDTKITQRPDSGTDKVKR